MDKDNTVSGEEWGEEDFFSDESSFYGDEDLKASFERRAACYDPTEWWNAHPKDLQHIAASSPHNIRVIKSEEPRTEIRGEVATKPMTSKTPADPMDLDPPPLAPLPALPYNPYEGMEMAKQLSEPLSAFLERLPPSSTTIESGPWIRIANPASKHRPTDPYIAGFKDAGNELLEEFLRRKRKLEEANPNKSPGVITKMLKADRAWLEDSLVSLAKKMNVTCGKWMLFPYPKQVDEIWAKVAKATLDGTMGCSAKVATDDKGDTPQRLICVYTDNFSDKQDVMRVLREMRDLKLVSDEEDSQGIYYKCDAYTYLDIKSGNDYKLKASMYGSRDLFKEMRTK